MPTLHDVLRALVRGDRALLNDAEWVERAVQAIDKHEIDSKPAPEPGLPWPVPSTSGGTGQ